MAKQPLAFRLRPKHIDDIIGQTHLVGEGKMIERMVSAERLASMILRARETSRQLFDISPGQL